MPIPWQSCWHAATIDSGAEGFRTILQPAARLMPVVNGVELYERRIGSGPPVVVLHGGPGAHHDYLLPGFDALARGRELIYYDQRGGGRSPVAREVPVGWQDQVADLEVLRIHWELDRLTLAGYSWGGLLAELYAIEHPQRVERLALVSPAPAWRSARISGRPTWIWQYGCPGH